MGFLHLTYVLRGCVGASEARGALLNPKECPLFAYA